MKLSRWLVPMQVGLTRDSWLLIVATIIAALGYLKPLPPPWEWSYDQWLQAALVAAIWLSSKLQTSWLPHSEEGYRKITPSGR